LPIGQFEAGYVERQPNRVRAGLARRLMIAIAAFIAWTRLDRCQRRGKVGCEYGSDDLANPASQRFGQPAIDQRLVRELDCAPSTITAGYLFDPDGHGDNTGVVIIEWCGCGLHIDAQGA
jgi:hypothetical protein